MGNDNGRTSFTLGQTKDLRYPDTCGPCRSVTVETKPRQVAFELDNIHLWLSLFPFPHLYYLNPSPKDPNPKVLSSSSLPALFLFPEHPLPEAAFPLFIPLSAIRRSEQKPFALRTSINPSRWPCLKLLTFHCTSSLIIGNNKMDLC